ITSRMDEYARARLADPDLEAPLCGYLFKARSPSCGIGDVRVLHEDGRESADGFGLFARAFRERHPTVPLFDESTLGDPYAREAAVCAFFAMQRWRDHRAAGGSVQEFERAHRVFLTARDPSHRTIDEVELAEMLLRVRGREDHARALAALDVE